MSNKAISNLEKDEIFLGNVEIKNWKGEEKEWKRDDVKHLKTLRIGEQAYDIYGKPLNKEYIRPLIIHKSECEEYDRIQVKRMSIFNRNR